jgi:ketosteroid isomerase-like protein
MSTNFHRYCRARFGGILVALLSGAVACGGRAPSSGAPRGASAPADAAAELLAADRSFAAAAERADPVDGVAPMFSDRAVMPVRGGFAVGRDSVVAALRADTALRGGRLGWTPVRVGISADGRQGFTLGYATVHRPGGAVVPQKYLTYWLRESDGWHAAVYRRGRASGAAPLDPLPPLLPAATVAPSDDSARIAAYRQSLDSAERAFSADAQQIGLRAAFVRYGSPDAMNMGGGAHASFVSGPDSIGAVVAEGEPPTGSSVSWAPDRGVIVASSGDLGVTIGTIVVDEPDSAGNRASFPFFTVWRRSGPGQPWRYVAE